MINATSTMTITQGTDQSLRTANRRRHKDWPKVLKVFFSIPGNRVCAACGHNRHVEAHHIIPFDESPELELIIANLIPLCDDPKRGLRCHLREGHLGDYRIANPSVRADVERFRLQREQAWAHRRERERTQPPIVSQSETNVW